MPVTISASMETDLVPPRALNSIRREVNERSGKRLITGPVKKRFEGDIPAEVHHQRSPKWNKFKQKKTGQAIDNVYRGTTKEYMPRTAQVTATSSGGRLLLRVPWAGKAKKKRGGKGFAKQGMPEWQRQEFETLSAKEKQWTAGRMRDDFLDLIEHPKYQRKRPLRRGGRG